MTLSHDTLVSLAQDAGGMLDRWRRAEVESAARRHHRPAASLSKPPARHYVSCDGVMYCTNQLEDDPQHPGEQRLIWQQMKVACVYWQDAAADGPAAETTTDEASPASADPPAEDLPAAA